MYPVFFWHAGWLTYATKAYNMNRIVSGNEFKKEINNSNGLSIVQFRIDWNGACQIISPIYDDLAKSYTGQADFFTIDLEANSEIEAEYGVTELPTILFIRRGEVIDYITGLAPKNMMISKIENALSSASI